MKSTRPLKTAIIGTGGIARAHVSAIRDQGERLSLEAAVDIEADRIEQFCQTYEIPGAYTDSATMLAEVQPALVHICTPPGIHTRLIIQSLEAGAWVLCEKPLCASLAEMDEIEAAEARTGNYCSSVFQWRFGSAGRHLRRLIDDGSLGRALVANILTVWHRTHDYYAVPWRGRWETELGGVSMGHGIHAMDFLLYLFGEWEEVRAMMGTLDREIEVEDVSMASVRFARGAMANITNSVLSPRQESYLRFDFQKATVELSHLYSYVNASWRYTFLDENDELLKASAELPDEEAASQSTQLKTILDAREQGERPPVSGPDVRPTIEFLSALYKSAFTGRAVERGEIDRNDPFYHALNGQASPS